MSPDRVGASVTGTDPATAPGGSVSPADASATPDPRLVEALRSASRSHWVESKVLGWHFQAWFDEDILREMDRPDGFAASLAATEPGASLLASAARGDDPDREDDAAEQDAARLAEALRTAPVAVEQTPQTAAWEVQRHRALAAHRERTDPGPIGTLDVDEG